MPQATKKKAKKAEVRPMNQVRTVLGATRTVLAWTVVAVASHMEYARCSSCSMILPRGTNAVLMLDTRDMQKKQMHLACARKLARANRDEWAAYLRALSGEKGVSTDKEMRASERRNRPRRMPKDAYEDLEAQVDMWAHLRCQGCVRSRCKSPANCNNEDDCHGGKGSDTCRYHQMGEDM